MPSIYAPSLPKEVEEAMPFRMSDLLKQTVEAHSARDRALRRSYEMMMRIAPVVRNSQRNSCQLIDPICFEHFLAMFASVRTARSQRPYWLFDPLSAEDEESAVRAEKGLSARAYRDGFDAALYDADWVSLRDAAAVMYIGWAEKKRNVREIRYREKGDIKAPVITFDEKEPEVEYDEVPFLMPIPERSGFDYNVPDRANFYMMTPDAKDVESSIGCGERLYWTANDLMRGIDDWKLDEEVVKYLLGQGPSGYEVRGEYQDAKLEVSGTDTAKLNEEGIGYWEVFRWFGKMPIWTRGGGMEIPDYLRNDEFLWMICPAYDKILRFSYSPYQMRPYASFRVLREPNGQGGESINTITEQGQEEATAVLRMGIDGANFRTRPVMKRLITNQERFGTQALKVGGTQLCEKSLNEIEALQWDHGQVGETMAWLQDIRSRTKSTVSGAGYGELQQKVRKEAEIEAATAAVGAKIGLFVRNLQEGMPQAALIHLSHLQQFGGNEPYTVYSRSERQIEVAPEDWRKVYSIKARGSADDASPTLVLEKRVKMMEIVRSSPLYLQKTQAGDMRPEFALMRLLLSAFDEEIRPLLGDEPPAPEYLQMVAQIFAQIYTASTNMPVDPQLFMQNPAMLQVMSALIQAKQGDGQPQGAQPQVQVGQPQMSLPAGQVQPQMNGAAPVGV